MNNIRVVFDHVGIPTEERHEDETWVEATRVWVTNPREHPQNVEYLRYEPDSPITNEVRYRPHIAVRVPLGTLDALLAAADKVLIEPWEAQKGVVRVAFAMKDGAVLEYMEYTGNPDEWFPAERASKK